MSTKKEQAIYQVNTKGLKIIRERLAEICTAGAFYVGIDSQIVSAWASELEDVLNSGNGDSVEIPAYLTKSGHVEDLAVPDSGISFYFETME